MISKGKKIEIGRFSSNFKISSARIPQSRRNSVDGRRESVVKMRRIFSASFPTQKVDLYETHRVYVRIAQSNRSGQYGIVLQKLRLIGDTKNGCPCPFEFFRDETEHPVAERNIVNQVGVETGNGEIRLGEPRLDVPDQIAEQRKSVEHRFQHLLIGEAIERVSDTEPPGQTVAALHPTEYPGNRAQIIQTARRASSRWSRSDLCEIKFQSRCGLLKIRNDVRIITHVLNVI